MINNELIFYIYSVVEVQRPNLNPTRKSLGEKIHVNVITLSRTQNDFHAF